MKFKPNSVLPAVLLTVLAGGTVSAQNTLASPTLAMLASATGRMTPLAGANPQDTTSPAAPLTKKEMKQQEKQLKHQEKAAAANAKAAKHQAKAKKQQDKALQEQEKTSSPPANTGEKQLQ